MPHLIKRSKTGREVARDRNLVVVPTAYGGECRVQCGKERRMVVVAVRGWIGLVKSYAEFRRRREKRLVGKGQGPRLLAKPDIFRTGSRRANVWCCRLCRDAVTGHSPNMSKPPAAARPLLDASTECLEFRIRAAYERVRSRIRARARNVSLSLSLHRAFLEISDPLFSCRIDEKSIFVDERF